MDVTEVQASADRGTVRALERDYADLRRKYDSLRSRMKFTDAKISGQRSAIRSKEAEIARLRKALTSILEADAGSGDATSWCEGMKWIAGAALNERPCPQ